MSNATWNDDQTGGTPRWPAVTAAASSRLAVVMLTLAIGLPPVVLGADDRGPRAAAEEAIAAPHAAALAFAAAHHPELAELLTQLEQGDPRAFATAIADLDRTRERLAKLEQRQPERHATALEDWKLTSRIQLVLARLALSKDPGLREELAELVRRRQAARSAALEAERDRLETRLARIDSLLAEQQRDPEGAVDRECRELLRKPQRTATGKTTRPPAEAGRQGADEETR